MFILNGVNFSDTAQDVQLDSDTAVLSAQLTKKDGGHWERQSMKLNDYIANENGNLTYHDPTSDSD